MDREWERADTYAIGEAAGEKKKKKETYVRLSLSVILVLLRQSTR